MADLASFRAYGALFADDREGGLNAIRAEARRMQERVTFEKEIRLATQQNQAEEVGPDDPEEDVEDPDEWWRLLQDGGEQERYVPESILSQNYTPLHATPSQPLDACVYADDRAARRAWPSPGMQS